MSFFFFKKKKTRWWVQGYVDLNLQPFLFSVEVLFDQFTILRMFGEVNSWLKLVISTNIQYGIHRGVICHVTPLSVLNGINGWTLAWQSHDVSTIGRYPDPIFHHFIGTPYSGDQCFWTKQNVSVSVFLGSEIGKIYVRYSLNLWISTHTATDILT